MQYKTGGMLLILITSIATAALPPRYRNANDLDVMIHYIEDNEKVITQLKSIDFRKHIVYYDDCKVIFGRKANTRPPDMIGPMPPLEFKREICGKANTHN